MANAKKAKKANPFAKAKDAGAPVHGNDSTRHSAAPGQSGQKAVAKGKARVTQKMVAKSKKAAPNQQRGGKRGY